MQFTFYDPPRGASQELIQLAGRTPTAIQRAMLDTLRLGESAAYIRSDLDLTIVSDRFCQTMLHVGLGLFHSFPPDRVAQTRCDIRLHGLAQSYPKNSQLDRSSALMAVKDVIKTWPRPTLHRMTVPRSSTRWRAPSSAELRAELTHHNFSACAGRFARAFVGLSEGWVAGAGPTAEDIEANLEKVVASDPYTIPTSIIDEVIQTCDRLGIG